ncbi:MAG: laccase domain-containing protein [bacterium]|nr:laccase domain-containing protein [bacterium]
MVTIKEESVLEEKFCSFQIDGNATVGMTHKNSGNFYPNGSSKKAFELAKKVLEITGFYSAVSDKLIIMRAEKHGDRITYFPNNFKTGTTQRFCDGVIYRGAGAAIFFPGGCPAIAFRNEKTNISGLLHGGWKSITQDIVERFFSLWENAGGRKETTQIIFLPSTCGNCLKYENDGYDYFLKTVYPAIKAMRPDDNDRFIHTADHSINFNLIGLICELFMEKGYKKINEIGECVCCSGKYWCYYHDDKNGVKHRNAAFITTLA